MPKSESPTTFQVIKTIREYLGVHPDLQLSGQTLDDMALELARAVMGFPIFASSRGQEGCIHCKGSGVTTDHLGYSDYPCDCRRAVPYKGPPPGEYPQLPKPAHRPYYDANGNLLAHGGYSNDQMYLYLATDRAQQSAPGQCLYKIAEPTKPSTPTDDQAANRLMEALRERDEAEEFGDKLLDIVLGHDRPEWSSAYGTDDALRQVEEKMAGLNTVGTLPLVAGPAEVERLSALIDRQHALLKKAKAAMTALHGAALPIDESGGDLDARIPYSDFERFVDEHAALLHAMAQSPVAAPAAHSDDVAVDRFADEMKAKLAAARAKGRGGWETCPPEVLSSMLREHVGKGDPRDVANFCMFLWCLGQPIAAAPAAPVAVAVAAPDAPWPTVETLAAAYEDAFAIKPAGAIYVNLAVLAEALQVRAALAATPPHHAAVRDAEKLLRAEAARLERIYGTGKWYGFSAEKESHLEHLRVAAALAATPAAPVQAVPQIKLSAAVRGVGVVDDCDTALAIYFTAVPRKEDIRALHDALTKAPSPPAAPAHTRRAHEGRKQAGKSQG